MDVAVREFGAKLPVLQPENRRVNVAYCRSFTYCSKKDSLQVTDWLDRLIRVQVIGPASRALVLSCVRETLDNAYKHARFHHTRPIHLEDWVELTGLWLGRIGLRIINVCNPNDPERAPEGLPSDLAERCLNHYYNIPGDKMHVGTLLVQSLAAEFESHPIGRKGERWLSYCLTPEVGIFLPS